MIRLIIIFFSILLLNSCGTILDSTRIIGKWKMVSADFYTYNEELDSYKKIAGGDNTADSTAPAFWAYFDSSKKNYVINFQSDSFEILHTYNESTKTGTPLITTINKWNVDGTDNSLNLEVPATNSSSTLIWQKGFKTKNFWPLANTTTLEITLIASDVGMGSFYIPTSSSHHDVVKMKGVFTKLN
jgi:hypothetical protein